MYDGLILGVLTWISFVISFQHFPTKIKNFLLKHFFIADILSVLLSFILLTGISKSIVSVIASIICGLLINLTLVVHKSLYP